MIFIQIVITPVTYLFVYSANVNSLNFSLSANFGAINISVADFSHGFIIISLEQSHRSE